jgi:hypothetical protein
MSQYLYLYRSSPRNGNPSPEQAQQVMQKWITWLKALGDSGHLKDQGQPLEPTGKLVKGQSKTITDGPFAEAKDIIGGFTLVEARDINEAAELSKGCPILEEGGTVEVRPIMVMNL